MNYILNTESWKKMKRAIIMSAAVMLLFGCLGTPELVKPVTDFDANKYLGKWYEIARLDHSFERGLEQVSAEYSLRDGGGIRVLNSGLKDKKWKEAEGKAFFVGEENVGYLKVSFFGPFYGSYIVFDLDKENYQYAFVCGSNTSYLWFMSRTPTVNDELKDKFIKQAKGLGFDTDALIWVKQ
jgi:apolipoprotein D and lipocalin family protein